MVQDGRSSRSSWAKSVRSSFIRAVVGKAIRESSIGTRFGKSSKLGMPIRKPRKRAILVCAYGRYQTGWERDKILSQRGRYSWETLIWENRHHSLTMFIWVALKRECQTSRDIVENYTHVFASKISAGAIEKLPSTEKLDANISSWSHDMEGHA